MTHISIMVKIVNEVIPTASIDQETPDGYGGKITSCFDCGGIYFYQVVTLVEDTENAIDTCVYCAQCGQMQGGIITDPFDEVQSLSGRAKEE